MIIYYCVVQTIMKTLTKNIMMVMRTMIHPESHEETLIAGYILCSLFTLPFVISEIFEREKVMKRVPAAL